MLTDFIIKIITFLDSIWANMGISTALENLLDKLNKPFEFVADFSYYMSGVYYIFGKPLVIYLISVVVIIVVIRLALAIINLVYP